MQTKPNKPEVFAGWQDSFPPISLNFRKWDLPFKRWSSPVNISTPPLKRWVLLLIRKSTIFIEKWSTICRQSSIISSSITLTSGVSVAVVCRKAYFVSYGPLRLSAVYSHPKTVQTNLHLKN